MTLENILLCGCIKSWSDYAVIQLCNGIEGCNSISLDGANNTADCASQNEPLEIATRLPRL